MSDNDKFKGGVLTPEMIEEATISIANKGYKPHTIMLSPLWHERAQQMINCGYVSASQLDSEALVQYYWHLMTTLKE